MEIEWKDGHRSAYTFAFLRDACPCALCEDERAKAGRKAGAPVPLAPGALPMFKPAGQSSIGGSGGQVRAEIFLERINTTSDSIPGFTCGKSALARNARRHGNDNVGLDIYP